MNDFKISPLFGMHYTAFVVQISPWGFSTIYLLFEFNFSNPRKYFVFLSPSLSILF